MRAQAGQEEPPVEPGLQGPRSPGLRALCPHSRRLSKSCFPGQLLPLGKTSVPRGPQPGHQSCFLAITNLRLVFMTRELARQQEGLFKRKPSTGPPFLVPEAGGWPPSREGPGRPHGPPGQRGRAGPPASLPRAGGGLVAGVAAPCSPLTAQLRELGDEPKQIGHMPTVEVEAATRGWRQKTYTYYRRQVPQAT